MDWSKIDILFVMKDIDRQILEDIRAALGSIREQIVLIDARLSQLADSHAEEGDVEESGDPAGFLAQEQAEGIAPETEDLSGLMESPAQDVSEAAPEAEVSSEVSEKSEKDGEGGPSETDGPAEITEDSVGNGMSGVEDGLTRLEDARHDPARFAWRTDRPGAPVRNILSAISINDRLLYERELFAGDPALFQKTISVFNSISSLAEAEAYIRSHFPEWKMDSDTVYRFMMAVRRRLS